VLTIRFPLVIVPVLVLGNACTLHEAQFISGGCADGVTLGVILGVLLGVVLTVTLGVLLGVLLGVGGGLVLVGVTVGVTDGVTVGVALGVLLGDILGVTEGADPNCILIHNPATFGRKPLDEIVGVGVGLAPVDGVILGVTLILGVLLTLGRGVRDGVLDTLIVGVGVILGGIVLLGDIVGVIDILGVTDGVTDILGVLLGVILGVTLKLGVILNDGVGVGEKGIQLLPTQFPIISIFTSPETTPGLLPHTVKDVSGCKATRSDDVLLQRV
jgi:hypothetical protein